jgi:hypothetical protein
MSRNNSNVEARLTLIVNNEFMGKFELIFGEKGEYGVWEVKARFMQEMKRGSR